MHTQPTKYQIVLMVTWADFSEFCDENAVGVYDIMQLCGTTEHSILSWRDEGLVPCEAFETLARRVLN